MQSSMEENKKTGGNQELENRFVQMLIQNDLWAWEVDLERGQLINYDFLKGHNPYGYAEEVIDNVPDSIIERGIVYKEDIARYRRCMSGSVTERNRSAYRCGCGLWRGRSTAGSN